MDGNSYLQQVLDNQTLADDGPEMNALRAEHNEIDALLREELKGSNPTIRYGGSKAKGTMIRESYDLDTSCMFPNENGVPGETLEEIFSNVKKALEKKYMVEPKTSALRILSRTDQNQGKYTHVDVVPGRFTDAQNEDCFLHQNQGDKERLKTNLDIQIGHIRDSGWLDAIRLAKLWNVRNGLRVKTFALELATIEILTRKKTGSRLDDQFRAFLTQWQDAPYQVTIKDPANPTGNDISGLLSVEIRQRLCVAAGKTVASIQKVGWSSVFGEARSPEAEKKHRVEVLEKIAVGSQSSGTKPWLDI